MFKLLLTLWLSISVAYASSYTFTDKDFQSLSPQQKQLLDNIYMIGETKGYGALLVAKTIVESSAKMTDSNPNHICGPIQIDVNYTESSCIAHETNVYYTTMIALEQLIKWKVRTDYNPTTNTKTYSIRSDEDAVRMYNVGYTQHPFGPTHVFKVFTTLKIIKKYYPVSNQGINYVYDYIRNKKNENNQNVSVATNNYQ